MIKSFKCPCWGFGGGGGELHLSPKASLVLGGVMVMALSSALAANTYTRQGGSFVDIKASSRINTTRKFRARATTGFA